MRIGINSIDTQLYERCNNNSFRAKKLPQTGHTELFSDKSFYDSFRKTDRNSVFYKNYDDFVKKVKREFRHYKYVRLIPESLFATVFEKYGTEEKSIQKILQDSGFDVESLPDTICARFFREFLQETEKTEKELAGIKDARQSERLSVVYTNAWKRSGLRVSLSYFINQTNTQWRLIKIVWPKTLNPEIFSTYSTQNLLDAYLISKYNAGDIRDYQGKNPLERYDNDEEMTKSKFYTLQLMYKLARDLKRENSTLNSPGYQKFKSTVDTESLTKTIENMEEHYKNAFLKVFWNDKRKQAFSEALEAEYAAFDDKVELSGDIYAAIMNYAIEAEGQTAKE